MDSLAFPQALKLILQKLGPVTETEAQLPWILVGETLKNMARSTVGYIYKEHFGVFFDCLQVSSVFKNGCVAGRLHTLCHCFALSWALLGIVVHHHLPCSSACTSASFPPLQSFSYVFIFNVIPVVQWSMVAERTDRCPVCILVLHYRYDLEKLHSTPAALCFRMLTWGWRYLCPGHCEGAE